MADELIPLEAPLQGRVRSEAELKGKDAVLPDGLITGEGFTHIKVVAEGQVPAPADQEVGFIYLEFPAEALT